MSTLDQLTEQTLGGLKVQTVQMKMPFLNFMVYGRSGVGKTLLAGSSAAVEDMCPVLLVDIEGGSFSLRKQYPHIDVVRVQTWKEMQVLYETLYDGKHKYKTVILDSLTEIQKFSMYNIMLDLIKSDRDRDPDVPGMREWGKNIEQMRRLVRAFRDLPINTIFTALEQTDKDQKTGLQVTKPSLSGKLAGEVAGFLDIVVYYYMKTVDGEMKRLLLTTATEQQVAKDRSDNLPPVLIAPTMSDIYGFVFGQPAVKPSTTKSQPLPGLEQDAASEPTETTGDDK